MEPFFFDKTLVKTPPVKRAAYSDRTAWIMAEISRLVYEPLPCEVSVEELVAKVKKAVADKESDDHLEALIRESHGLKLSGFVEETLQEAGFALLESFARDGTEAVLARLLPTDSSEGMLILAFRGTSPNIKDILTDVKCNLVDAPISGKVHKGFLEAYNNIASQITSALKVHKGLPFFITGHSLGGALAMVATRYLESNETSATYTLGCPRVADDTFFADIKTPVYRIVNAADGVPRIPFGYGLTLLLSLIRLLPINGTRMISEFLRRNIVGYTHFGNLVFLNAPRESKAKDDPSSAIVVTKSPNIFWRVNMVFGRLLSTFGKAAVNDHLIFNYSKKLLDYARSRN
jgi:triacylglycerol lipase